MLRLLCISSRHHWCLAGHAAATGSNRSSPAPQSSREGALLIAKRADESV